MKIVRPFLLASTLFGAALGAQPASALTIDLFDTGGVGVGTPQYKAFRAAADYWESVITTDTTLRIKTNFTPQGVNGPIGGTSNYYWVGNVGTVLDSMKSVGDSAIDATVAGHLPDYSSGSISMWMPGMDANGYGASPYFKTWDSNGSYNNYTYGVSWGLGKALGLVSVDTLYDGTIGFNSDLNFDFDPSNGISAGAYDFTFTAVHEIGHILGFTSGVDYLDTYAPSPYWNYNWDWVGHGMDIFRYSADGLDWSLGGNPYFSIDGGATALFDGAFSTGVRWGDGWQASHWLPGMGLMDPNAAKGEMGVVNALDLAAFDALGWNLNLDVLANPDYRFTTGEMFGAVPEPATWALLIAGFGMVGLARRRQRALA